LLAKYIEGQTNRGDLKNWSVLLAGKDPSSNGVESKDFSANRTGLLTRSNHSDDLKGTELVYRIRRLVSPADESWDLNIDQYQAAKDLTAEDNTTRPGGEETRVSRDKSNALLILYPLKNQTQSKPIEKTDSCYLGFAISFPGNKNDIPIKYRVNQIYQEQINV
jgi:hypothetical protein